MFVSLGQENIACQSLDVYLSPIHSELGPPVTIEFLRAGASLCACKCFVMKHLLVHKVMF